MDEEDTELRNPYPSPPSHYTKYTTHNLNLLQLLQERAPETANANQHEVLSDQTDVPEWTLVQLEKPRVDWILEEPEPYYEVFGDRWFVKETIPSLAELGGNQLYPTDPRVDRRPALRSVLRSLLLAYSTLTSSLLLPPPPIHSNATPDWHRHVEWITVLSQNIMAAANDLRPVQARFNLETMMKRQLEVRRTETRAIHSKCDELEQKLKQLRASVNLGSNPQDEIARQVSLISGASCKYDDDSQYLNTETVGSHASLSKMNLLRCCRMWQTRQPMILKSGIGRRRPCNFVNSAHWHNVHFWLTELTLTQMQGFTVLQTASFLIQPKPYYGDTAKNRRQRRLNRSCSTTVDAAGKLLGKGLAYT
ncbi:hypothetical protein BDN72DRAFT_753556 [Pluteus cervinus]|uniref:Uncharacterized protein n=1 Tax=Pluteus cervinus TaxID=181527 RepID=A0ACD3BHC1_9AGAR|nr:hypothetical protein BDN72DRAFT_753556 [Pluteus cervinus]